MSGPTTVGGVSLLDRVDAVLAAELAAAGVGTVFGVIGEANMTVVDHLVSEHGVAYHAARREDSAVAMADGFARVSGQLGVATVTHGPGLSNAFPALVEAAKASTPLLVVAGNTDRRIEGHPQDIDQEALVIATGAAHRPVELAGSLRRDVRAAIRQAHTERRPVVLDVPVDLLDQAAGPAGPADRIPRVADGRVQADGTSLERAAGLLAGSSRPVVLAGRGAVRSGSAQAIEALAAEAGALLGTTVLAKGWFRHSPYDLGLVGGYSSPVARSLLAEADCVVAFGASLNRYTTDRGRLFPDARLIHCDDDAAALNRWTDCDQLVHGDARDTAIALRGALQRSGAPRQRWRSDPDVGARLASYDPADDFEDQSGVDGMDLRAFTIALDAHLPADRGLAVDVGHFTSEACKYVQVQEPQDFVFTFHSGTVGLGLASAIGASLARPDRWTVAVVGDGGLMMSLGELDTAVRCGARLVVVVMNDGAYGAELHNLRKAGLPTDLARFPRRDFAALASAMGFAARVVTHPNEVAGALDLDDLTTPVLVDGRLNPEVITEWYAKR